MADAPARRPLGITILAAIYAAVGVLWFTVPLLAQTNKELLTRLLHAAQSTAAPGSATALSAFVRLPIAIAGGIAAASLVAGPAGAVTMGAIALTFAVGLWRLNDRYRVLTMALAAIAVLPVLLRPTFAGTAQAFAWIAWVVAGFGVMAYLRMPRVRAAFR